MNNFEHENNGNDAPKKWSRRRLIGGAAGAILALSAAGGGLLAAGASASTSHATTHASKSKSSSTMPNGCVPGGAGAVAPTTAGTVESVDAASNTFTLKDRSGTTVTVDVTASTTYKDPSVSSPSLANVTVGEQVGVVGTSSSGTVTATSVMIGLPPRGPGGPGQGPRSANSGPQAGAPPVSQSS